MISSRTICGESINEIKGGINTKLYYILEQKKREEEKGKKANHDHQKSSIIHNLGSLLALVHTWAYQTRQVS